MAVYNLLHDTVRQHLRISNPNAFFDEIEELIDSAIFDLKTSGVNIDMTVEPEDPLIRRAIINYCKAHFGIDNKDSEKYESTYEKLKNKLCLCGDYNHVD